MNADAQSHMIGMDSRQSDRLTSCIRIQISSERFFSHPASSPQSFKLLYIPGTTSPLEEQPQRPCPTIHTRTISNFLLGSEQIARCPTLASIQNSSHTVLRALTVAKNVQPSIPSPDWEVYSCRLQTSKLPLVQKLRPAAWPSSLTALVGALSAEWGVGKDGANIRKSTSLN